MYYYYLLNTLHGSTVTNAVMQYNKKAIKTLCK